MHVTPVPLSSCESAWLNEFTLDLGRDAAPALKALQAKGILGGVPLARYYPERKNEILVPADHGTCTGCYTAIPRSQIGPLVANGILIDGCEMCGAIIYVAEVVA